MDMSPKQLAKHIQSLPARPAITSAFEALSLGSRKVWYTSQKQHWLGWLSEYDGPGYYGRKDWRRSAEFVYKHVVCPPMVLWLGEASGVPKHKVKRARDAALASGRYYAAQSSAIRRIITWSEIELRLVGREGAKKRP
jgi:hypothetical protein